MDFKKVLQRFSTDKARRNLIIAAGILGMLLILLSNFQDDTASEEENADEEISSQTIYSEEDYKTSLETQLTQIISQISGAGEVSVMITLDCTAEDVYAADKSLDGQAQESAEDSAASSTQQEYSEDSTYVIVEDEDGNEHTVLLKQIMPKVSGVLVVCSGGDDSVVKEKVTNAVSSVLGVSRGKVYVTG